MKRINKKVAIMSTAILSTLAVCNISVLSPTVFAASQQQIQQQINDVPTSHWAYPALKKLIAAGLIEGDSNQFVGDKPMSRYEIAVLVSKAMDKLDTADVDSLKLIMKLSYEFSDEINKLKSRMDTVENKVKAHVEGQIIGSAASNTNSDYKLGGSQKYGEVFRVRFIGGTPDDKLFMYSEVESFIGAGQTNQSIGFPQGTNFTVSQGWFRAKDIWGMDSFRLGRMSGQVIGIGGPLYSDGSCDGVEFNKKIGQTNWKLWTGAVATTSDQKHPNQLTTLEASYALSSNLNAKLGSWWNSASQHNTSEGDIFNAGADAGFDRQTGIDCSWDWKLSKDLHLLAEGTYDTLTNPTGGLKKHPVGYAIGLINSSDSHRPAVFTKVMGLCDFHKPGATGWSIIYGSNDAGCAPKGLANAVGYNAGAANGSPYTVGDNVNVLSARYEYVICEGLSTDVTLARAWIKDKSLRSSTCNLNGDNSIVLEVTAFFS
ncbi:MAG: S-layer y domain protein [Firmicutes bacterium]|nr:S-layer y domain protein [Bacillota bacterium]